MRLKFIIFLLFLTSTVSSWATITSVVTVPASTDTLSNGKAYYLAGKTYTFRVFATDPDAGAQTDWGTLTLEFYNGAVLVQNCQVNIGTGVITVQNGVTVDAVNYISADNSNIEYQITLRFLWTSTAYNAAAANRVSATVQSLVPASNTLTNTVTMNYGIITDFAVSNFIQGGDASDTMINPWHESFDVTGTLVYYMATETITNTIQSLDAGEVSTAELYRNGGDSFIADTGVAPDFQFTIPADWFRGLGGTDAVPTALGNHTWDIRATMNTGGAVKTSINTIALNCDKIQVTSITFVNGGGINLPYYRSINIPTTEIRVVAQMQNGGGALVGNTNIVINDGTNDYTVPILDGNTTGQILMTVPGVAVGSTNAYTYTPSRIYGGAYDGNISTSVGQYLPARIVGVTEVVNWENADPPTGVGTPFLTFNPLSTTSTADSFTLNWTPLVNAFPDQDFYTYRIYYKETSAATWTIVDRSTADYGLGGGGDTYRLDLIGTGSASITGLLPLTSYDYFISAVDIFGNEVAAADRVPDVFPGTPGSISTTASSVELEVTDGITVYNDASFNGDPDPVTTHPLRKTAIRVTANIITAGNIPDSVWLVIANNSSDDQWGGGGTNRILDALYGEIEFKRIGPNKWEAFIPSDYIIPTDTQPILTLGTTVRFIIRIHYQSGDSWVDHDSEADLVPPGNPDDLEWRFYIANEPKFTPWPTRVLNNVIDDKNPVAYPSYYLTDDAYVTIKAYDIKGRVVAVLLEDGWRPAGQNIKENGWRGINKAGKKLGIGLYYIHIKAKRASDGKVLIDKFNKVVMAR